MVKKTKTGGLYQAIIWSISNKIGRPAGPMDLADALGVTKQTVYNKISSGRWSISDLETVCEKSSSSLYVSVVQSSGQQLQQRMFPLYETEEYIPDFQPRLKTPVTMKIPK